MGTIPFGALQPFDSSSYLVDSMSVAIAPSLFDVIESTRWPRVPPPALLVANPRYAPALGLRPLPGAANEVQRVAPFFAQGTRTLGGSEATREAIERTLTAEHQGILYLATHGVADASSPLDSSYIALAADEKKGQWTARDIQHSTALRDVRLVILSACETGLGQRQDAGIVGMARAFQLAGVRRVVMSLWQVDDEATAAFMTMFAEELQKDSPNNALQATMIRYRKEDSDPRHWAAFSLFGDVF
jgi:CHAT domain-containing protein